MLKEAITTITKLAQDAQTKSYTTKEHNGETIHLSERGTVTSSFSPPLPRDIGVLSTLSDFAEALRSFEVIDTEEVHVLVGPRHAHLHVYNSITGKKHVPLKALSSTTELDRFLGTYHAPDEFVLKTQCLFSNDRGEDNKEANDLGRLLGIAGHFVKGEEIGVADDGITQVVTIKKGIEHQSKDASNPFTLRTYWGFPDAGVTSRDFILRVDRESGDFGLFPIFDPLAEWNQSQLNVATMGEVPFEIFI